MRILILLTDKFSLVDTLEKLINDNSGLLFLILIVLYVSRQWYESGLRKKENKMDKYYSQRVPKIMNAEEEMYQKLLNFSYNSNMSSDEWIVYADSLNDFIIVNEIYLREDLVDLGFEFTEYILNEAIPDGRDIIVEKRMIGRFVKKIKN